MARDPSLLDAALARSPAALMLSFADPAPFADRVRAAGVRLICQVHTLAHARRALEVGAAAVQGTEAGGHGLTARGTAAFVPAVADLIARERPETLLLAAGGIADGRGLAAALALGADGVLMGTRFWATREALIHPAAKQRVLAATGDETIRTQVYDIARQRAWPAPYTGRLLRNAFIETWHGREDALRAASAERRRDVEEADAAGDYDVANVTVGEAVGLIDDLPGAGDLVLRIAEEAEAAIRRISGMATAAP
ncbi:nitronate monooxygenase [Methylobacterium mesophilicum]|uniref:NAD(P)H-dependent flavin oxidoreductase n=1 Tax=Methylobacterium mesophilicum TaxID=39956 RepID=UPI002F354015